jgi:hypothetical protein
MNPADKTGKMRDRTGKGHAPSVARAPPRLLSKTFRRLVAFFPPFQFLV